MSSGRTRRRSRRSSRSATTRRGTEGPSTSASGRLGPYERVPSRVRIDRVARALRTRGFDVTVVATASRARTEALRMLRPTDTVLEATSQTLREIGLVGDGVRAAPYRRLRPRLQRLANAGRRDAKRRLGAAPEVIVGSVHAVTDAGEVVAASGTGSQLGPYSYGAGRVLWIVGSQKIVRDLPDAFRRIRGYAFPREDARVRAAGGAGSSISQMLIVFREPRPHRTRILLVAARLGV